MKFSITSGPRKGHSFEVHSDRVKIGRKKDNDVVLNDESVSGHHARFEVEGGQVFVVDLESVNGIELNGKPVKRSAVHEGDVLAIGKSQIKAAGKEEEPAPISEETSATASWKTRPVHPKKLRSRNSLKIVAALLVFAVIAAGSFLFQRQKTAFPKPSAWSIPPLSENIFRISYEKVQATDENIFRYEMKIEDGSLSIMIDDLKQGRQLRKNKALDPSQVAGIQDAILEQKIFSLPPVIEGKSQGNWDSYTLALVAQGQAHRVRVLNRVLPDSFKRVCAILENFGETELGMVALSMPLEELTRRANGAYQRARKLYDERFVKMDNLFNSIKAYNEVTWYLDTVEPKPAIFAEAIHGRSVASEELDEQIKDHQFEATKARQLKEWKKARDALTLILQKLPDPSDKQHQDARALLLDVEKRIRPQ